MIVRNLRDAQRTTRRVTAKTWESTRLLLKDDGVGFSFHITTIYAGTETHMWYKNHYESVYCLSGTGEIEDKETGLVHTISPGTIYLLDKHDRHVLRAQTELTFACVFNPSVTGQETHDEFGVYPAAT